MMTGQGRLRGAKFRRLGQAADSTVRLKYHNKRRSEA